jgi:type IX secretion system PorP/SprF family membrane protein
MKRLLTVFFFAAIGHFASHAQVDPHFSQYYVYPAWLNPALTGAIDGDYRISGVYRNQWNSISNAFSTAGISADVVTNRNINFGASLLQQKAGTGGYKYFTGYVSIAYTGIRFDNEGYKRLVFGLQGGIVDRRFDRTKFNMGDQWNPITGYNPSTVTADQFPKTSSAVFDAGAGVVYYDATPGKKSNVFAGFSASHLTQPEDAFTNGPVKGKLPIRYTVHGGVKLNLSDAFNLVPNALYLRQGTAEEKMLGAYGQIKSSEFFDFILGFNYRFNDAMVPFTGFFYKNMTMGFSYDANTSELGKNVNNTNSFELSLSYTFKKSKEPAGRNFVCPRL